MYELTRKTVLQTTVKPLNTYHKRPVTINLKEAA